MKFGKLTDISGVDFTLPADHPDNQRVLNRQTAPTTEKPQLLIGCPAWTCKEWVGKIYPTHAKSADFLKHYAKNFQTVEMNATYYRTPETETVQRWKDAVEEGFLFCPKISKQISHFRRLKNCENLTEEFCHAFAPMEEKLGAFFLQLPPNFTPSEFPKLENFVLHFPAGCNLGVEFRHPEWFANKKAFDSAALLLQSQNMLMVITDVAGRRDVLHQRLTSNQAMIRFVGNSLHATDYKRIDDWIEKLGNWAKAGLEKVYFFVHEPEDVLCPELASYLVQKLQEKGVFQVLAPSLAPRMQQSTIF